MNIPKISKNGSGVISLVFAAALVIALLGLMVAMPWVIDKSPLLEGAYTAFAEGDRFCDVSGACIFWIWIYSVMTVAVICCASTVILLVRVRKSLVFTDATVSLIRLVSWGALLIALLCALVGHYLYMAYMMALAACFLGITVRTVKNVIEEATAIKNENDLTV